MSPQVLLLLFIELSMASIELLGFSWGWHFAINHQMTNCFQRCSCRFLACDESDKSSSIIWHVSASVPFPFYATLNLFSTTFVWNLRFSDNFSYLSSDKVLLKFVEFEFSWNWRIVFLWVEKSMSSAKLFFLKTNKKNLLD